LKPKVLFIDDDLDLSELIKLMLTRMGFEVDVANNGLEGLKKGYSFKPDVIVLDVMMPEMDGWQTCQRFREMTDVPIIMLTALGSQEEVIKGLNLGADDYLVKPITADELGARVRALLRRVSRSETDDGKKSRPIFSQEGLIIDLDKYEVTRQGQRVDLSPTEYKLLSVLVRYKGRVLPHEFLLTEVWGAEYVGEIDYLRLYISYLRRKLEADPASPTLIHNEWGVGYRFG
jgi:DNA-binding response OmpR family regulator